MTSLSVSLLKHIPPLIVGPGNDVYYITFSVHVNAFLAQRAGDLCFIRFFGVPEKLSMSLLIGPVPVYLLYHWGLLAFYMIAIKLS